MIESYGWIESHQGLAVTSVPKVNKLYSLSDTTTSTTLAQDNKIILYVPTSPHNSQALFSSSC